MPDSSLTLELRALREHFVAGEPFRVEVVIENHGEAPCEVSRPTHPRNWQPTYVVLDAAREVVRSFDLRRGIHGPTLRHLDPADAVRLRLEPGERWSGIVRLDLAMALTDAGRYELLAILDETQPATQSGRIAFTFEPLRMGGLALGTWNDRNPAERTIFALWLHRRDPERVLFERHFRYEEGDDGGVRGSDAIAFATTSPAARDPLTQTAAHAFLSRVFHFAFCREADELVAFDSLTREPVRRLLPPDARLVGLPFLDRTGIATQWIHTAGRAERVRWLDPILGQPPPTDPDLVVPLPPDVSALAVTVDPSHGHHHLAAFALASGTLRLDLLPTEPPPAPATRSFTLPAGLPPALALAPDAPAVAWLEPSGALRLGLALHAPIDPTHVLLLEARVAADACTWLPTPLELPAPLVAARLAHLATPDQAIRRAWALWTADGSVLLHDDAGTRIVQRNLPSDAPRGLVVLESSYLLPHVSPIEAATLIEVR